MAQHYKQPSITASRINVFLGWEPFNPKGNVAPGRMDQNVCGKLWYGHDRSAIALSVASPSEALECPTRDILESHNFSGARIGDKFGPTFSSHLFRLNIAVPQAMYGYTVHLIWDSNSEAMVLNEEGQPMQGMVGGDSCCRRADYPLFPERKNSIAKKGDNLTLYIEIACNGLFGAGRGGQIEPPDMNTFYALEECCIAIFDPNAWSLIHDVTLLAGLAKCLPEGPRRARALNVANQVVNVVDVSNRSTYQSGISIASEFLSKKNGESQSTVYSMLHSHIDLAWLWPMAATPAKAARTFSTQLRLMDMYPDCTYVQSQAQLYEWVKNLYPSLWNQICRRVKEGRFIPVGGTWVEMDCNIPSGESLVRQFIIGQNFFMENFMIRCSEFWLPDTFGYAAQLPQIMKGCGIDYFMTQKLSWNLFNKFPHSSFVWEGLDGTRVLAHMPPADTYNAQAFPEEVLRSTNKNKDSGVISDAIMLVGHGDGGGGASPAMIESMHRMANLDGVPRVKFSSPREFFSQLEKKKNELPRWVGELYFELHRGTYTSQAKTKLDNRQCENLLQEAEMLNSHALLLAFSVGKVFEYPAATLKICWKIVLKNCFHDTLPGSSIGEVYVETARDYEIVQKQCLRIIETALVFIKENWGLLGKMDERMAKRSRTESSNSGKLNGAALSDINFPGLVVTTGTGARHRRRQKPYIMEIETAKEGLGPLLWQQCEAKKQESLLERGKGNRDSVRALVALSNVSSGLGVILSPRFLSKECSKTIRAAKLTAFKEGDNTMYTMSNGIVKVNMHETGILDSLRLVSGNGRDREALCQVQEASDSLSTGGNRLVLYDDVSQFWCGWDTEVYSFEKQVSLGDAVSCKVVEEGPLRVALHFKYPPTRAGSTVGQFVTLRAGSARVDFRTEVDWKESRKILRVLFNTQVRSDFASYETQFGYLKRPTTFNHSWEIAKFEVVGHRFCDISEYGFGVAVMNDCKYGYSVRDSTIRLSLLRAAKSPDDTADIGKHYMTYGILPHWNSFPSDDVLGEAGDLNSPARWYEGQSEDDGRRAKWESMAFEMITDDDRNATLDSVIISSVKRSENRIDEVVVRMYESMGGRGRAIVRWADGLKIGNVTSCNMLEEVIDGQEEKDAGAEYDIHKNICSVSLEFKAFEIRTISLTLANQ